MSRRSCANCGAGEWIDYRWCRDCWCAAGKGAAAELGALLVTAIAAWLIHWFRTL